MKFKIIIITAIINCLSLSFTQESIIQSDNKNSYTISSERYISDINGNIRMNVNIWGHVAQPGSHLVFDGIDMVTLLSIVGGPKDGANLNKIKIIREVQGKDGNLVYNINFNKFLNSGDRSAFIKIMPNDTILISQKLFSNILSRASNINTILSLLTLYLQLRSLL